MYFDSKNRRILLRDGTSVMSPYEYTRSILENSVDQNAKVLDSVDGRTYEYVHGNSICSDIYEIDIVPENLEHDDSDIDAIYNIIKTSKRYDEIYDDRIISELEFFIKSTNITFLIKVYNLVQKFKRDGIVWGVGRGSGSASLILYLLEVHDIDPIKYDISFSEMSKEVGYD